MTKEEKKYYKVPTTYEQQVEKLKSRNLMIEDDDKAIGILKKVNYYRLSAYMLTYKTRDGFYEGVSISEVYSIYSFDKKLRNLLLGLLEDIEISFRTQISYHLAHKFGAFGYADSKNFKNKYYHNIMLDNFETEVSRSDEIFVHHHKNKYSGEFPVWVIIEVASFGVLSKMYSNLLKEDMDEIASNYYSTKGNYVKTWLYTLSSLRNKCAHYSRLYNKKLTITPKLFNAIKKQGVENDSIFASIYVIGRLYNNKEEWEKFISILIALIEDHPAIELEYLGFPEEWEAILRA